MEQLLELWHASGIYQLQADQVDDRCDDRESHHGRADRFGPDEESTTRVQKDASAEDKEHDAREARRPPLPRTRPTDREKADQIDSSVRGVVHCIGQQSAGIGGQAADPER